MPGSIRMPKGTEHFKKIPFQFTEEITSKNVFLRLPDAFSPMERMILQSNGNLQRLLSAYYNEPSQAEIIKNDMVMSSPFAQYDREMHMFFANQYVYKAESFLVVKDKTVQDLIEKHKYGLGQLFSHTHSLPEFTIHSVGRYGDSKGASFWRDYSLIIPNVIECFIRETFKENLFEEFKGNRTNGTIWFSKDVTEEVDYVDE